MLLGGLREQLVLADRLVGMACAVVSRDAACRFTPGVCGYILCLLQTSSLKHSLVALLCTELVLPGLMYTCTAWCVLLADSVRQPVPAEQPWLPVHRHQC
jgi:hypothetical protein